jgi:hypothetical protein
MDLQICCPRNYFTRNRPRYIILHPHINFSRLSLFLKNKNRFMMSSCSLCAYEHPPPINFWMPLPAFINLGTYTTEPVHNSTAYFINPSHQSVCMYVYPPIFARLRTGKYSLVLIRQRIGKNFTVATKKYATIEELLDATFSMSSVSYQGK